MKNMSQKMVVLFAMFIAVICAMFGCIGTLVVIDRFGMDGAGVAIGVLMLIGALLWWQIGQNQKWLKEHKLFISFTRGE